MPIDEKFHAVPHLKALINGIYTSSGPRDGTCTWDLPPSLFLPVYIVKKIFAGWGRINCFLRYWGRIIDSVVEYLPLE